MEALGEARVEELTRVEFYTSHEGLNLHYEGAFTTPGAAARGLVRPVHPPCPGSAMRTRALDGAHVEYFRGISNPIGVKVGPTTTSRRHLRDLADTLDPEARAGTPDVDHAYGRRQRR